MKKSTNKKIVLTAITVLPIIVLTITFAITKQESLDTRSSASSIDIPPPTTSTSSPIDSDTIISKVLGVEGFVDKNYNIPINNSYIYDIRTGDLGVVTKYNNKLWLAFGDTLRATKTSEEQMTQFIIGRTDDLDLADGITLSSFVNLTKTMPATKDNIQRSIIEEDTSTGYTANRPIPNSAFVVKGSNDKEELFMSVMNAWSVTGNDHQVGSSYIVKYFPDEDIFKPYKYSTYFWDGVNRLSDREEDKHMYRTFDMTDMYVDTSSGYIYVFGSPSGRYGGLRIARITIEKFIDPDNTDGFEYHLGDNKWTSPTTDMNVIFNTPWAIHPKMNSPEINPLAVGVDDYFKSIHTQTVDFMDNDFEKYFRNELGMADADFEKFQTTGELDVFYLKNSRKYILLVSRYINNQELGGIWYYSAPNPWGPWTEGGQILKPIPRTNEYSTHPWLFYAPYTDQSLINEQEGTFYVLASTWEPSVLGTGGVYLLKLNLPEFENTCEPACSNNECGDDGCGSVCGRCISTQTCSADNKCVDLEEEKIIEQPDPTIDPKPIEDTSDNYSTDINNDKKVSIDDYAIFIDDYNKYKEKGTYNQRSDFNNDNLISLKDYNIFLNDYFKQ